MVSVRLCYGAPAVPPELLMAILDEMNDSLIKCAQASSALKSMATATLLLRHNIGDPSAFCEVELPLPDRLSQPPMPDALAALLPSRRRFMCIKRLDINVQSKPMDSFLLALASPGAYNSLPAAEPAEERIAYMFPRILRFLSRVETFGEVHLGFSSWTRSLSLLEPGLNKDLEVVVKKTPSLHLHGGYFISDSRDGWRFPTLIADQSQLRSLHADDFFLFERSAHMRSSMFISQSPLTHFTIHMEKQNKLSLFSAYGVDILFQNAPQLRALTVEGITLSTIRPFLHRLESFLALTDLTISCDRDRFFVPKIWP
ncbi:hypothetical protein BKA70DRAFT_1489832 [Coprinopsis sp. MPI-PUGE-AT-0042]|nr:hypothetical protein BKA70DRAFT_1489832 [Coprinopsis sp. MPI-PUGE-AT-0042]